MPSIDSNKLKNSLRHLYEYENFPIADIELLIDHVPVMDMELIKHGHWIHRNVNSFCSNCLYTFNKIDCENNFKYCPNCGAKMDN